MGKELREYRLLAPSGRGARSHAIPNPETYTSLYRVTIELVQNLPLTLM